MMRQRGFVWWAYAAGAVAVLATLWLAYTTIDGRGYDRGKGETEAIHAKRDNAALHAALAKVQELERERASKEMAHQARLGNIVTQHGKDKANAEKIYARNLAAARAGDLRLRDPGRAACTANSDTSPAATTATAAARSDDPKGRDLSAAATGFLLDLTAEADTVARQLTLAQAVILEQQQVCR